MGKDDIPISNYKSIYNTGAKPGQIICGIGYTSANHIGSFLYVIDEIKSGQIDIDGDVRIIDPGNLVNIIDFISSDELMQYKKYPNLNLKTNNFVLYETVCNCVKRFKVGDTVKVTEASGNSYYQPGEIVIVKAIYKFPDQRVNTLAHYKIWNAEINEVKDKLDSGLEYLF